MFRLLAASAAESVNFTYDWADNIITESKSHTTGGAAGTPAIAILNEYQYDGNGRKINFLTTISGIGQHVAEYNYNYRDELVERNLHANQVAGAWGWLQSVDYGYNNQGWLTSINDWQTSATVNTPASCTPPMPNPPSPTRTYYNEANDLFMLDLRYNQPETGIAGLTAAPPQKAGNISQIIYRVRGREASIMSYSYDYLSRLSTSTFHNYSDAGVISGTNNYNENLTYDLRGNIQTLQRTGFYQNGGTCTYGQIDNLTYSYPSSPASNKVHKILDGTTTAGDAKSRGFNGLLSTADNSLTYDANGNLDKNLHKNISSIAYNHLNLPKLITFSTGNTIEFLYDAAGNKLRKTTKTGATVQYVQDYFPGGIEYRQTGTGAKRVESVYHAEGRYYNTNVDASNTIAWRKEYSFKDHLGNTRLAFTDRNANGIVDITGTASTSDILQENHYYSFGLAFEGAWLQNDAGVRDNQYMYNGKELHSDFGLGMYAYGARYYDPSIGRFIGVDPISDEFPFVTTFNYAENEPIGNIDLHGLQKFSFKELGERTAVFLAGTANAIGSNMLGGAGRGNPAVFGTYANSARNGQRVGDAISVVVGLAESTLAIAGVAGEGLLVPVSGGATALAIAPTVAVGVHGTMTATTGMQNLVKASSGDDETTHQTYTKNPKDPSKDGVYSGRTSGKGTPEENIAKRDANHHMNDTHGPAVLDKSSKNKSAIRGREQQNIEKNGGAKSQEGTSGNAINGISSKNRKGDGYRKAADDEFGPNN